MNVAEVEAHTEALIASGHRLLQIHRFAGTPQAHVERLLRWAEVPEWAVAVDMGAGTGEMAEIIAQTRPDITWILVNISKAQLDHAPGWMQHLVEDFHRTSIKSESVDIVFHCFSLGHGDYGDALAEARRVLKPGGALFIYDMIRVQGTNDRMEALAAYHVERRGALEQAAQGFALDFYLEPEDRGGYGASLFGAAFHEVFGGTVPAVWRFVKCK